MLPAMVGAAEQLARGRPNLLVVVAVAPTIPPELIVAAFAGSRLDKVLVTGKAAEVIGASDAAVVKSGTAVLEAALMERPFVVVYRVAPISYLVARLLLRVKYVSLVNLLLDRRAVPELLQGSMTPQAIAAELERLWNPGPDRDELIASLRQVRDKLAPKGAASRAAEEIASLVRV